jgi:PEP-CTERM motif
MSNLNQGTTSPARRFSAAAALLISAGLFTGAAHATLQLSTGLVGGSGDVENVLLTNTAGAGNLVTGELNQTHKIVNFTSNEAIMVPAGGQARIEAVDGAFSQISWQLADPTLGFSKVQFNIDAAANGFADIFLLDQFGTTFSFLQQALDGSGQNLFTGFSLDNQVMVQVSINSDTPFTAISDLQQVRLGTALVDGSTDPGGDPLPEPGSLALVALGLAAGAWRYRKPG